MITCGIPVTVVEDIHTSVLYNDSTISYYTIPLGTCEEG